MRNTNQYSIDNKPADIQFCEACQVEFENHTDRIFGICPKCLTSSNVFLKDSKAGWFIGFRQRQANNTFNDYTQKFIEI